MNRSQLGWLIASGLILAAGLAPAGEPAFAAATRAPGLMVHIPFNGSFTDASALGAVRPEAESDIRFVDGANGRGAAPGPGHQRIGRLHVSRLSKLALHGRTPASGTVMFWFRELSGDSDAAGDSAATVLLACDSPLNLVVGISGDPPRLSAVFEDGAGNTRRIEAALSQTQPAEWCHLALGWDSKSGRIIAFVQGEQVAETTSPAFTMAGLPKTFELGAPGFALDEFRLYKHLLDVPGLRAAAGL
jgi:hypothetical protein